MGRNLVHYPATLLFVTTLLTGQTSSLEPAEEGAAAKPPKVRITASPETTILTGPLRDDGYVDYIAAVNQIAAEGVTLENNAAVLFARSLGPECFGDMDPERFSELLGIEPLSEEGKYFVSLDEYASTRWSEEGPKEEIQKAFHTAVERPWNEDEFSEIARWLRLNQESLALFCRGCQRPRYYTPMLGGAGEGDTAILLVARQATLHSVRDVARSLSARAMLRLKQGNAEDAWTDLLACHRLARLVGQDPTLWGMLVSISIDRIACRGDANLIASEALTARLARTAVADLQALDPLPGLRGRIEQAERFTMLDSMTAFASGRVDLDYLLGFDGPAIEILENVADMLSDWDLVLQRANEWFDRSAAALEQPTYAERAAAFEQLEDDIKEVAKELVSPRSQFRALLAGQCSRQVGDFFVCLLLPAMSAGHRAEHHGMALARLRLLGYALAAYRTERGTYPEQLKQLVPGYLPELPSDPFTRRPFHDRLEKSAFLLYSVGFNMEDNLGKNCELDQRESTADAKHYEWDDIRLVVPPE